MRESLKLNLKIVLFQFRLFRTLLKEIRQRYECITRGKIQTRNAIFLDNSFNPKAEFYHKVKSTDVDIFKLNFATQSGFARSIIEKWAYLEEEEGFAENFLQEDSISEQTSMLLYSSIHFRLAVFSYILIEILRLYAGLD